jgi:DNA repair ATPase RecN
MTAEFLLTVLQNHGLSVVAILVIGWAYWQERLDNKTLNSEIRENLTEMTTALVGARDSVRAFVDTLNMVGSRLDRIEHRLDDIMDKNKGG